MIDDLLLAPVRCAIYVRLSQDRTGTGLAVARQEKECRILAERLGFEVERVYTDNDLSATSGKTRPGFEQMLRDRPEVIVAWHQDRLLRLSSDLERVIDLGIPAHFVTAGSLDLATPAGRAVGRTVAAWTTYETEQKALRQKAANVQRAEKGTWQFSRRPYGYERVDGRVVIVEAEAVIVREAYSRYIGGDSLYVIANDFNRRGVPTFDGPWSMARVQQMLRNSHYAGIVTYRGNRLDVEPSWTPLIDERTWSDYLATREGRSSAGTWSRSTKHLLSGMLRCHCGERMLARPDRGVAKYSCRSCWTTIPAQDVEPFVEGLVLARLNDKRIIAGLRSVPNTAPVEKELADLRRRRSNVVDLLAEGVLDRRRAREQATQLSARIDALAKRLSAMRAESPLTDLALARSIPTHWKRMPMLSRRRAIEELGLVVTCGPGRRGRRRLDASGTPIPELSRLTVEWSPAMYGLAG